MTKTGKTVFSAGIVIVSACSTVTQDPWSWLEDPKDQIWKSVVVNAIGRDIHFSIPDLSRDWGNHVLSWPENENSNLGFEFTFPLQRIDEPFTKIATFTWDTWWGGFYKKGGEDFYFSVGLYRLRGETNLLDLNLDQRVKRISEYWVSRISETQNSNEKYQIYFLDHLRVTSFTNENGLSFVEHNAPRISGEFRKYTIPLSAQHYLEFSFYVNELRFDRKEDPAWNQSRWEMVEKIMKTVRITPDPFGDQPEDVPAQ